VSWPIILPIFSVGFILGALWHRAHAADIRRRHPEQRIEIPDALLVRPLDHDTEYRFGRRGRERIARS
jgi:hypothetical protein